MLWNNGEGSHKNNMMRNHCLTVAGQRGQELVSELSGNTAVGKMKHDSMKKSGRNI